MPKSKLFFLCFSMLFLLSFSSCNRKYGCAMNDFRSPNLEESGKGKYKTKSGLFPKSMQGRGN